MTKLEIARELAERKDMPLADAIKAVDGVIDIMKDAFKNGRNGISVAWVPSLSRSARRRQDAIHELEKLSSYLHTRR